MPGWLSAAIYLIGFYVLHLGADILLQVTFGIARLARRTETSGPRDGLDIMNAVAVGMPTWVGLFIFYAWGFLLTTLAFSAIMAHLVERRRLTELGLTWTRSGFRDLAVGLALATILFVSVVGVGLRLGWYQLELTQSWQQALLTTVCGFLILLPLAAVEEVSVRGYFMHAAGRSWGPRAALLSSALVFAAFHAGNPHLSEHPLALGGLVLAGLYLGLTVRITGSLWLAIFLHTGWNLMEGPIFGLPVSGMDLPTSILKTTPVGPDFWTGGAFGPEAGALLCFLLLIHVAVLWAVRPLLASPPAAVDLDSTAKPLEPQSYRAIPLS